MKRVCSILFIFVLMFTACLDDDNNYKQLNNSQDFKSNFNIIVKTEITLGSCDLEEIKLDNIILVMRLYEGEYYEEFIPGSNYGPNWKGKFELCVINNSNNKVISSYKMSEWDVMSFKEKINIKLKDYNNDGIYEFLIGQYASNNYNIYRMYYLTNKLEIGYYNNLGAMSITDKQYSLELEVDGNGDLLYDYYDNAEGGTIHKTINADLLKK